MKANKLHQKVQDNLKEGEEFLNFLSEEIQKSSRIKVSLGTLFDLSLKEEQKRYSSFQNQCAVWTRDNFVLRRELLFKEDHNIEKRKLFLALLEDEARTVENLFDSWEDTVEEHRTTRTDALKVTIPLIAVIISLLSFVIALTK